MGKLRNKLMAGLVAALSMGSTAVNNNINVFASSGQDLKNTALIQEKMQYADKSWSFANLTKLYVNAICEYVRVGTQENGFPLLKENAPLTLELNGVLDSSKRVLDKNAMQKGQSDKWCVLDNNLICDIHGNILTYGDLYPNDKNLIKGGKYEILGKTPVLAKDGNIIVEDKSSGYSNPKKIQLSTKLTIFKANKYKGYFAKKQNHLTILVNKDGKPLNFNGDKLVETYKENALQIDNDTFGLPYYEEPEEIIIEKQPKIKEDHLEKQSNQEKKIHKYKKPKSTTNSAQPNAHPDVPSSQSNPSKQPKRSKSVVSKNAAITASILGSGVILGGGITYTSKRSKSKSINKIANSNKKIQNNKEGENIF